MNSTLPRRLYQFGWLVIAASCFVLRFGSVELRAAPSTSTGIVDGLCWEECGPTISCDQGCWWFPPELPANHTTCGNYAGDPWGGVGMCVGTCGDDYCNDYADEDAENCYEDCGTCGNGICDGPEDLQNCAVDCHTCGDGYCSGPWETCVTCGTDCNPTSSTCGPGLPGTPDDCDPGYVMNGEGYCCELVREFEGLDDCDLCGEHEMCVQIFDPNYGYWTGTGTENDPYIGHSATLPAWGCVKTGSTCEGTL